MFKYVPASQQLRDLQKKNAQLQQDAVKQAANLDYVAMMTDVDLPDEEEAEINEQ